MSDVECGWCAMHGDREEMDIKATLVHCGRHGLKKVPVCAHCRENCLSEMLADLSNVDPIFIGPVWEEPLKAILAGKAMPWDRFSRRVGNSKQVVDRIVARREAARVS